MRHSPFAGAILLTLVACSSEPPTDGSSGGAKGAGTSGLGSGGQAHGGSAGRAAGGGGSGTAGSGVLPSAGTGGNGAGGSAGTLPTAGTTSAGGNVASGGAPSTGGMGAPGGAPTAGVGGSGGNGGVPNAGSGGGVDPIGGAGSGGSAGAGATHWVGTWANGPQTTEQANLPPSPGLANNTLRQLAHVSIGGSQIRVRISNAYGKSEVALTSVHIAKSTSATTSAIDTASDKALAFSGMEAVKIAAGKEVWSDAVDFTLAPLSTVAVSIAFGAQSGDVTGHPGSRTTSYLMTGNQVSAATISGGTAEHWYFLTGIDVMAPMASRCIAVLGDSITDGRGSTTNMNDRWPDQLAKRLQGNAATTGVAVLNLGIGGNAVVSGGLGPTAVARYDSDILGQSAVRWVIVLEGVNDIGANASANSLTGAFQQFIDKAHAKGLKIYGVPVLPFAGNTDYDSSAHQTVRTSVNDWVRAAGHFDAVLDLDAAVRDAGNAQQLMPTYDSGDHLHLSPAGYQKMADAIDLTLFGP